MGEIETIREALESIIRRVALVSPYYEKARAALSALESLEQRWGFHFGQPVGERPTPPAECGCKRALKLAIDHLEEMRTDPRWHPIGRCPVLVECRAALSSPCSPCSACAEARADARAWQKGCEQVIRERDALQQRVKDLEEGLRQIQWGNHEFDPESGENGAGYDLCPMCDQSEVRGHAPDCLVGMALTPPAKESRREAGR